MDVEKWFLTARERGNPACTLPAWCAGNAVQPLVNGATYFAHLTEAVQALPRKESYANVQELARALTRTEGTP